MIDFLHIETINEPFNISTMPDLKKIALTMTSSTITNFTLEYIESMTPLEILNLCPLDSTSGYNHTYTFKIMNYCFNANISIDDFLSWYMQKSTDELKLSYKARI